MITLKPCLTKKELSLFEAVPEHIHKDNRYFVPPFPGSIAKLFGPKNPFSKIHGDMIPFVAYQDGKPVGRIAAIVNRTHNKFYKDKIGFFGFFESVDEPAVAKALFDRARKELRDRGMDSMRGPYNPTINDECGVLVEGFECSPLVLMPYNPAYYLKLYELCGLKTARNLLAFYISASTQAPDRIRKIAERVRRQSGLTVRSLSMKNLADELKILHELYNVTLDRNWGFVPISYEDLEYAAEDLKAIVDPSMVLIAEKNGRAVGFSLTIPDVNEIMYRVRSSSTVMRVVKFLWYLKTSHPKKARLAVLGVHPEYRNTGIGALFYYETLLRGKRKYEGGELSWIDEDNDEIVKGITVMGGEVYKKYRIYEGGVDVGGHA